MLGVFRPPRLEEAMDLHQVRHIVIFERASWVGCFRFRLATPLAGFVLLGLKMLLLLLLLPQVGAESFATWLSVSGTDWSGLGARERRAGRDFLNADSHTTKSFVDIVAGLEAVAERG